MDTILSKPKSVSLPDGVAKVAIIALAFLSLTASAYFFLPLKVHWSEIFRPATLELISGGSPYNVWRFFNPPWALIPLVPFALLPAKLGSALVSAITVSAFGYVAHRFGARGMALALFFLNPYTLYNFSQVNIDWMVYIGLILPPQIGLFFVLVKPQIGWVIALFWVVEASRDGGIKLLFKTFIPVLMAFAVSGLLYGPWLLKSSLPLESAGYNLWPHSIPIGLLLMFKAIRERKISFSASSAPLLAPYIQPYSYPVALLSLLPSKAETIIAVSGLWVLYIFQQEHFPYLTAMFSP